MAEVALRGVSKSYGATQVVRDLSLDIREGEFLTLLGASGSGKTTCLRMVAGFVRPDSGQVLLGGRDATDLPPYRRNTGMVFQQYALFPHLSVAENVAYGLKVRRLPRADIRARAEEVLRLVQLDHLKDRKPAQLSGGQKQRVALARAVAIRPEVLLLDEPLSALDLKLRGELQSEIRRVQRALGITTLFVTHDQGEALGMSDRVAVMRDGQILQVDSPVQLYRRPASTYVANFVGTTNFIDCVILAKGEDTLRIGLSQNREQVFEVRSDELAPGFQPGEPCRLCVRPEHVHLGGDRHLNRLDATVVRVTYVGQHWIADCVRAEGEAITLNLPAERETPRPGDTVTLGWAAEHGVLRKAESVDGP